MATLTVNVDDETAEWVRLVAASEQKKESDVAARLLQWAALQQKQRENDKTDTEEGVDDALSLEMRRKQIRQIFTRNEW